ncbi:MAG: metal-dependent transcriptional regulator [Acholeplasmataceae bacterium]|nr:metal-dependent transcriptional regulator [Acholeplasmataceae bacterium]
MNRAEEDYIKTIYELTIEKKQSLIKTNDLAEQFGYTDQSVNEMIKKLEAKHLVSFYPYKGLSLTNKGRQVAIRMIRSHRIWEVFLTEKLGFSWENVHDDAEMLEHATSDEVIDKLYDFLGKPKYCQHGNPIPDQDGNIKETTTLSLYDANLLESFQLKRVLDSRDLLIYLNEEGIRLDDVLKVVDKDDFNGILKVERKGKAKTISIKTAKMLFGIIIDS